jgi:hypothetical protein
LWWEGGKSKCEFLCSLRYSFIQASIEFLVVVAVNINITRALLGGALYARKFIFSRDEAFVRHYIN